MDGHVPWGIRGRRRAFSRRKTEQLGPRLNRVPSGSGGRRGEEDGRAAQRTDLGSFSLRCRRWDPTGFGQTLANPFDRLDQRGSPEHVGDPFGLLEESSGRLKFLSLEVEAGDVRESPGIIEEVAPLLQRVQTPIPNSDRAFPA